MRVYKDRYIWGEAFEGRFHTYCKDLYTHRNSKPTTKRNRQNRGKVKRTKGLTVLDLKEDFLNKQTKKKTFEFKHNDGDTIRSLFGDKIDDKETDIDKDNEQTTEKETQKPKQAKRKRRK